MSGRNIEEHDRRAEALQAELERVVPEACWRVQTTATAGHQLGRQLELRLLCVAGLCGDRAVECEVSYEMAEQAPRHLARILAERLGLDWTPGWFGEVAG